MKERAYNYILPNVTVWTCVAACLILNIKDFKPKTENIGNYIIVPRGFIYYDLNYISPESSSSGRGG